MKGYVQVYTGTGKGKTTAAVGLAVRAAGAGLHVYIGQFVKSRRSSEFLALQERFPEIVSEQYGSGGFIRGKPTAEQIAAARSGLKKLSCAVASGRFDVVVADELCTAVALGLVAKTAAVTLAKGKPQAVELIITGGNAQKTLVDCADLVTDMKKVKHYYDRKIKARKGIEV